MRYYFLIIFACLLLILPVTAYTVPNIQTLPGCSGVSATTPVGFGEISFTSTPPGAWISLDGQILHTTGGGMVIPMMTPGTTNAASGSHTVMIGFPSDYGYSDYSSSVTVCNQQVTYVSAILIPIPTTVPTTLPTTAAPVRGRIIFAQAITTPVTGTTTAVPTTDVTVVQGVTTQVMQQTSAPVVTGSAAQPDTLGSLSVTTTPAGAFIFIDGVQRGVTPATIPELSAGTHSLLLKLDGYQDISTPVTIVAGKTQDYSSDMAKNAAAAPAVLQTAASTVTPKKAPGFECVYAFAGLGGLFLIRKRDTE